MNARIRIITLCMALAAMTSTSALAQGTGAYVASVRGDVLVPLSSLASLFDPGSGMAVTFGQRSSSDMLWEGIVEAARFAEGNKDKLYFDDLSVKLEYLGGGVQGTYFFGGEKGLFEGMVSPYVSGAVTACRWTYVRGEHATDSTGFVVLPEFSQQDWSMNFRVGAGIEVYPVESIGVYAQASYQILVGEIWPTLALRVEGVSAMQMAHVAAGVRVWF